MRTSWNWLAEFVDLEGLDPREVADRLTLSGVEVEGIHEIGALDGVVVARIVKREQHPDADKLSVCTVDFGGDEPAQVVCGAPNARDGLVTAMATVGTLLPGDFKIKKSKIRGVKSFGMLCSASELEISDAHDGILELDDSLTPGTPFADAAGTRDVVFELGLTPDRSDCLSMFGVAREIGALFGRELKRDPRARRGEGELLTGPSIEGQVEIRIDDADGCPRYAAAIVRGVKVGPAPPWMVQRLAAVGQRSVNNLVDVTNYALFENGQPLHAFDLAAIRDGQVVVRTAAPGESIESIDHVERELDPADVVIADGQGPVAIAGVMGGAGSEISDETTDILIECAHFNPSRVRVTARRHGMHTESSHRFERGVDPNRVPDCLLRAVELVLLTQEHLGVDAVAATGTIDVVARAIEPRTIALGADFPGRILGIDVSADQIVELLGRLGLTVAVDGDQLAVTVPTYRPDLERPIDLVEEVGRLIGYDELPSVLPSGQLGYEHRRRSDAPIAQEVQPIQSEARLQQIARARHTLGALGFYEAVNWGLSDPDKLLKIDGDRARIQLLNPLGAETSVMRSSLLADLLKNLAHNLANGAERVALFEVGGVFDAAAVHTEPLHLGVVLCGRRELGWTAASDAVDAHDLVGVVEQLAAVLGRPLRVAGGDNAPVWAHPAAHAAVVCGNSAVGWAGQVHPSTLDVWEIEVPVFALELDLGAVLDTPVPRTKFESIVRMPGAQRDVALLVDRGVTYEEVRNALDGFQHAYLEAVDLFDVYEGDKVPDGKKSLALSAQYRRAGGSLTDKQIEKAHAKLVAHLSDALGAVRR